MFEDLFFVGGFASALWASVWVMKEGSAQHDGLITMIGLWGAIVSGIFGFIFAAKLVKALL